MSNILKCPSCCDTELSLPKGIDCGFNIFNRPQLNKIYFNPETKEVFNDKKEFMGLGEIKDGVITLDHDSAWKAYQDNAKEKA